MYLLSAIILIIAGICLFVSSNRMTGNSNMIIVVRIVSIALVVIGIVMSCLLLSGKVVLPLSTS